MIASVARSRRPARGSLPLRDEPRRADLDRVVARRQREREPAVVVGGGELAAGGDRSRRRPGARVARRRPCRAGCDASLRARRGRGRRDGDHRGDRAPSRREPQREHAGAGAVRRAARPRRVDTPRAAPISSPRDTPRRPARDRVAAHRARVDADDVLAGRRRHRPDHVLARPAVAAAVLVARRGRGCRRLHYASGSIGSPGGGGGVRVRDRRTTPRRRADRRRGDRGPRRRPTRGRSRARPSAAARAARPARCVAGAPNRPSASLAATCSVNGPGGKSARDAEHRLRASACPGVSKSGGPAGDDPRAVDAVDADRRAVAPAARACRAAARRRAIDRRAGRARVCTSTAAGPPRRRGNGPGRYCAPATWSSASQPGIRARGVAGGERRAPARADARPRAHQNPTCARRVTRSARRVVGLPSSPRPNGLRSWSYSTTNRASRQRAAAITRERREHLVDADDRLPRALDRVAIGVVAVVAHADLRVAAEVLHDADREAEVAQVARRRDRIRVDDAAIEVRREHRLGERGAGADPAQAPVDLRRRRRARCDRTSATASPGDAGDDLQLVTPSTIPFWFSSIHWKLVLGRRRAGVEARAGDRRDARPRRGTGAARRRRRRRARRGRSSPSDPGRATARRRPARRSSTATDHRASP